MPGQHICLHGLDIDRVTEAETIATILAALHEGRGGYVVTPNVDQLRQFSQHPELGEIFDDASLVVADGMPLVWASRVQGTPLAERVAGSELVWSLTAEAARRDRSIFLLGGPDGTADAAATRLRTLYPGATIAGCHCPPLGFERDPAEIEQIVAALREAAPDIVYVALGFPKQERLIAYLRTQLPGMWFLGVGCSLSFIAGDTERAPDWMMRLGLEWAHRLVQEPRRLARRYIVHGLPFAIRLFARATLTRVRGQPRVVENGRPAVTTERVVFARGAVERERAELLEALMRPE
jgi:N-acetylglucosaminyldiphosphoundecaprenol N-acetyl-beta-D-mannosaminyltransferase